METNNSTQHETTAPQSYDSAVTRRLYRTEGPLSGVAGGLADYFKVDPTLVRLGLVVGALVGGPIVPVGYLAAWVIIPEAKPTPVPPIMAAPVSGQPVPPAPAPPTPVPPAPVPPQPSVDSAASTAVDSLND